MKKKMVALMLGLTLCFGPAAEAGAETFGTPEDPDAAVVQIASDEMEDAFSTGELQTGEEEAGEAQINEPEAQNITEEQGFSAGIENSVTDEAAQEQNADTADSIHVKSEDWVSENNSYKLRRASSVQGTTPGTGSVDGYYTLADGVLKITTQHQGREYTGYYLFDENGYMVTGQAMVPLKSDSTDETEVQEYFTPIEKAVLYPEFQGEAVAPYNSDLGKQKRNQWIWTGTVFQFYDATGAFCPVEQLQQQYQQQGTYKGYIKIENDYYYLKEDGTPLTGDIEITAGNETNLYYFQPEPGKDGIPGKMFHKGWRCIKTAAGERWLYYNQGVTNPSDIGKYYKRGITATVLDKKIKGNDTYLIDSKGYILKNTMKKAANGAYYCTDKRGVIYKNKLVKYSGARYYFDSKGKRAAWQNRWAKCTGAGNHYYYFGKTPGKVSEKKGWQKVCDPNGKFIGWYYFDSNGNHYTNKLTSEGYYFTPDGKLASGLQTIKGKKYIFETSTSSERKGKMYKNTMVRYKKKWYFASKSGPLIKSGWKNYNGNWYYIKNYEVLTNSFIKRNGVNGYVDSKGKYTTGWVVVSNAQNLVRYINPDGKGKAKDGYVRNDSKIIDGTRYFFDKNGYRITDLTSRFTGPYFIRVDKTNGVATVYTDSTMVTPVKTIRVSVGLPGTPTPDGYYKLKSEYRWQPLMGPSWGQYGTHVEGAGQGGIYFHSVACSQPNSYNLPSGEYNKLGSPASHGCIRTCVADAKWIYEHCNGATVYIMSGPYISEDVFKGPLGKKPLTPLRGSGRFDPTDPAVNQ